MNDSVVFNWDLEADSGNKFQKMYLTDFTLNDTRTSLKRHKLVWIINIHK